MILLITEIHCNEFYYDQADDEDPFKKFLVNDNQNEQLDKFDFDQYDNPSSVASHDGKVSKSL